MPPEHGTPASRPPPGHEPDQAAAPRPAPAPSAIADDAGTHTGDAPTSGGLPGNWGKRLPLLMLAAGLLGVGLLIATSDGKPKRDVDEASALSQPPASESDEVEPPPAAETPPPAAATPPVTGEEGAAGDEDSLQALGEAAGAKSALVTAAQAMETCATDNRGSYTACTTERLVQVEPTLEQATELTAASTDTTYTLTNRVESTGLVLTLKRTEDGVTERTCTPADVDVGCKADGTW